MDIEMDEIHWILKEKLTFLCDFFELEPLRRKKARKSQDLFY
jgi:hypothetical protein